MQINVFNEILQNSGKAEYQIYIQKKLCFTNNSDLFEKQATKGYTNQGLIFMDKMQVAKSTVHSWTNYKWTINNDISG